MTDEENYRSVALYLSARRAIKPVRFEIHCSGGCGMVLGANLTWPFTDAGKAEHLLAERALKKGWDIDRVGNIACPDCHKELMEGRRWKKREEA